MSYAPFRRPNHSPFDPTLHLEPAEIEADLRLLREMTSCVRTYGVDHGLDAVPAIARALGMRVLLGAWIGGCLLYTSPSPRDRTSSRMPSSA